MTSTSDAADHSCSLMDRGSVRVKRLSQEHREHIGQQPGYLMNPKSRLLSGRHIILTRKGKSILKT